MKKLLALCTLMSAVALAHGQIIALPDGAWNYNYDGSASDLSVSSGTLTSTGGSAADRSIWQYFGNTTLSDGDSLTVSFNLTLTDSATNQGRGFSVGLFNSNDTEQTGAVSGVGDGNMEDDAGYLQSIGLGGNNTTRLESYYGQATNRTVPISTDTGGMVNLLQVSDTINDTSTHAVSFTVTRTGSMYSLASTLDGSSLASQTDVSSLANNASYAGTESFTFDLIAFGIKNLNQDLEISNLSLTQVPEPSTYALISGMASLALLMLRRRLKR